MKKLILMFLLFSSTALAQMAPYYLGTGVAYDYYGKTGFAALTSFGARLDTLGIGSSDKLYSCTVLEMTKDIANIRTGACYNFVQYGNWILTAIGDAGLVSGNGPILGSFTAGGLLSYDIGNRITKGKESFYLTGGIKFMTINGNGNQPVFGLGFIKGFGK